ncbi:hypothetical protein NDU88_003872 [Pleurodeles waltl]|uniref:Uncharacterized protein n=1 Tax=Pleurodeles waltl TaxID=8319 RepID=A0AAV7W7E9_PLEWA|nr:hypothetical protein NDU88_003872 [Pleurodeles waltl]
MQRQITLTMDYHIFIQQCEAFDDQDQPCEREGLEKSATAAQEGSEEDIRKGGDQGSETRVGGSPSEADVQEEIARLDTSLIAWSEEWYTALKDAGEAPQLRRVAV